jgi:hypothetical protein
MKMRFSLLGLLSIGLLTACPPPPKPVANGWTMDFRAGTINLDSSAASGAMQDATYRASLQKIIQQRTGLQLRLPTEATNGVKPQASIATGVSFYVALQQNGALPSEKATLEFSGPQKAYSYVDQNNQPTKPIYAAGSSWFYSQIQTSQGSGAYRAQAEVSTGLVSAQANVDVSNVLNPPTSLEVGASPDGTLAADWNAISNAKSYLAIVYDLTAKQVVWSGVGKGNTLEIFSGLTLNPNNSYDLTISAFNFEIDDSPKAPALTGLEANVNSVIFRQRFGVLTPALRLERKSKQFADSSPVQLFPLGKPSGEALDALQIVNSGGGAMRYEFEFPNDANVTVTSGIRGLVRNGIGKTLGVKTICDTNESERTITGQLKTNATNTPNRPVFLRVECVRAVINTTEVWKSLPGINNPNGSALSPDGTKLLMGGSGGLRLWDVTANQIVYSTNVSLGSSDGTITWKPDGSAFAYVSGNQVIVHNATTYTQLLSVDVSSSIPSGLAWSPDGTKILVYGYFAKIINANTGNTLFDMADWRGDISSIQWSPNSANIAAFVFNNSLNSKNVTVWDANTGVVAGQIATPEFVSGIAWSADSSRIAGGGTNKITTWSVASRQEVASLTLPATFSNSVTLYAWRSNDQHFVVYFQDKSRTINAVTGNFINEFNGNTKSIALSSERLLIQMPNNVYSIFNLETGAEVMPIRNPSGQINTIAWHPDGTKFAVATGQTVQIIDKMGAVLRELPSGEGFFWSRDGSSYATYNNSKLQLRNSDTGSLVREISVSSQPRQVAWNGDGSLIAIQEFTSTRVVNSASGADVWSLADGRSLSANATGTKLLVRIGDDFNNVVIRVYGFATGVLERTVDTTNVSFFFSLAWSSNEDRFLAYGGVAGGLVRMFDLGLNINYLVDISGGGNLSYQWSNDARRLFLVNRVDSTNFSFAVASPISGDVAAPLLNLTGNFLTPPQIAVSPDGTAVVISYDESGLALYNLTYSP